MSLPLFLYRADVERVAASYRLDPDLVQALCLVESSGNRFAWNPEPSYRWLWDVKRRAPFRRVSNVEARGKYPPADFPAPKGTDPDQEWWGQQASWGLMQVMGAVAREYGFQEPYLPQLCEVGYNLVFGCQVLAGRIRWAQGEIFRGLAAYNAGPVGADGPDGQAYARKVLKMRDVVLEARAGVRSEVQS